MVLYVFLAALWLFVGGLMLADQVKHDNYQYPKSRVARYFTFAVSAIVLPVFLPTTILSRMEARRAK